MRLAVNLERLVQDLRHLGLQEGDQVLVHSSLSSIGQVDGGADTVIDALLSAVGPNSGTVLVPTLTGTSNDSKLHPPHFHARASGCWTGKIPETFRMRKEASRSLHPTHSVAAIGADAVNLTTGHEDCWTPCGYGSPYYRLARRKGKILLLGVTLESNTTFHGVEELAGVDYHLQTEPATVWITDERERLIERTLLLHDWGTPRTFSVIHDLLLEQGIMRRGAVGEAQCLIIDTEPMLELALEQLRGKPRLFVPE
ncbi:aminoglycoside N(3)-acetyltransferase [Paenibacillus thermotolerans]|uniref:aminoglycoside N(3)-acetyltransferase n=1 Tax=Paenibacillus thermotolerans TaxID=3027807 RepID=UPI002368E1F3|nr:MULTISPECIES: AAC(3) family N-acetyltransferase [unclassified Paenibacillus]